MKNIIVVSVLVLIFLTSSHQLYSCTAFYVAKGDTIFAGNNEDWFDPITKMWFVPSENGNFGRVYFGFGNFHPQGGMNEKGLFFDGFATEVMEVVNSEGKPYFRGNIADHVMATFTTVEEVIEVYKKYNLEHFKNFMLMFGDAYGKSVIIEGDDFVLKEGDYQICTNFYQSKTKPENIDCWRYLKVQEMLEANSDVSVESSKSMLQAAHADFTQYSNVYDLKNKKVYLYHFHNFDIVYEFDLQEELKKGQRAFDIASLFPVNEEYLKKSRTKVTPINNKPMFIFLVFSSIVFLISPFVFCIWKKKRQKTIADEEKNLFNLFKPAQIIGSVSTIAALIFIMALSQYPEIFKFGLPRNLAGLSVLQIILIHIPVFVIVLTIILIVHFVIVFKKRFWTINLRLYYILVIVLLLVNLGLLNYWNLLRL